MLLEEIGKTITDIFSSIVGYGKQTKPSLEKTGAAIAERVLGKRMWEKTSMALDPIYQNVLESARPVDYRGSKRLKNASNSGLSMSQQFARLSGVSSAPMNRRGDTLQEYGVDDWQVLENADDYMVMKKDDEIVVVNSATRLDQEKHGAKDFMADVALSLGAEKITDRYIAARNVTKKYIRENPGATIYTTGTSLGGKIADDVARELDIPSYTFNLGSSPIDVLRGPIAFLDKNGTAQHANYIVKGDVISNSAVLKNPKDIVWIDKGKENTEPHSVVNFF